MRGGGVTMVGVLFAIFSLSEGVQEEEEINASQDESVQYTATRTHAVLHLPHAVSNRTTQFSPSNSVLLIRSHQPIGKGNPHPAPPFFPLCPDIAVVRMKCLFY